MLKSYLKSVALTAIALFAASVAHAATPAYLDLQSGPVYWGTTGATAILVVQYDQAATASLTVRPPYIGDVSNNSEYEILDNCGTPIKTGDTVTAYSLAPGQHCFLQTPRTVNSAMYGEVIVTDGTASTINTRAYVRAMFEIRDGYNNVLTHAELR